MVRVVVIDMELIGTSRIALASFYWPPCQMASGIASLLLGHIIGSCWKQARGFLISETC